MWKAIKCFFGFHAYERRVLYHMKGFDITHRVCRNCEDWADWR
jgi:hypothetical protein